MNDAVDFYNKAANATENDFTTPLFLWKAGLAYEALGKMLKQLSFTSVLPMITQKAVKLLESLA